MRAFRSLVAGAVVCVCMTPTVKSDYLRKTGPPPLRFAAEPAVAVTAQLPPLAMFDPPLTGQEHAKPQKSEPQSSPDPELESIYAFWRAFWDNIAGQSAAASAAASDRVTNGQDPRKRAYELWMQTTVGTNAPQSNLIVPIGPFEPPAAATPQRSTATYSTP